ncbi:MAG: SDR family NAD(P)-dependent oxidoreductase [Actinomycetota bacterium]
MSVKEKTALVTGAGSPSGIGWATAVALAEEGARVVATDVDGPADGSGSSGERGIDRLVGEIQFRGGQAIAVPVDITDRQQMRRCLDLAARSFGPVDILVNNAATISGAKPFLDITDEEWDLSYRVNLKGTADFCQEVLPGMIDRGAGVIVNVASTGGLGAEAGFGAYTATKHAVVGITKTIAAEFGRSGIRCNAVCPGFVATDMHQQATRRLAEEAGMTIEEMGPRRYAAVAMGRPADPVEIAAVIRFLAGDAASYLTGAAIPVSGGTPVGL